MGAQHGRAVQIPACCDPRCSSTRRTSDCVCRCLSPPQVARFPMTDPKYGAAICLVCHGSHQYSPFMLAYIPAPWILWDRKKLPAVYPSTNQIIIIQLYIYIIYVYIQVNYDISWLVVEPYPSEKYDFVSWDDKIPNIWKNKIHVPKHQQDMDDII